MGEPDGVLMFDETGFVKKGQDSVGVARQYCGTLGKVENCQVGVFAAYASRQGYALVDKRLFLPEAWFTEAYAARRTKCKVPAELTFQSKPQLAAAMLQAITRRGSCRSSMWWRIASTAIVLTFWMLSTRVLVSSVRRDPRGHALLAPAPQDDGTIYRYKGAVRSKRVAVAPVQAACPVGAWRRACRPPLVSAEGLEGPRPIVYEFARNV